MSNFAKQGKSEKKFVYQFVPKKVKIGENIFLMKNYTIDKTSFTILSFLAKRLQAADFVVFLTSQLFKFLLTFIESFNLLLISKSLEVKSYLGFGI